MLAFVISCASGSTVADVEDAQLKVYLASCEKGCAHLATLPEADNKKGCKESRPVEDLSCAEYCTKTMTEKTKKINPDCWVTLEACSDFEETCNLGELYP